MSDAGAISDEQRIGLYKMEYEQCVSSYQNIYEAIWRIFSYLSAVTAAILIFGTQYLTLSGAVTASMIPLLVWSICIYWPMNKYGNQRCERLAKIEETLNKQYGVQLEHFTLLKNRRGMRVVYGVIGLSVLLGATLLISGYLAACHGFVKQQKEPLEFKGKVDVNPCVNVPATTPPSR